jgi:hypothetical protein
MLIDGIAPGQASAGGIGPRANHLFLEVSLHSRISHRNHLSARGPRKPSRRKTIAGRPRAAAQRVAPNGNVRSDRRPRR